MSHVIFCYIKKCIFFFKKLGLCGGAHWWRVCYQWGLPRFAKNLVHSPNNTLLEDTARYAGLLLAPAEGFGREFFLPLGQKKEFIMLFWLILGHFGVQ